MKKLLKKSLFVSVGAAMVTKAAAKRVLKPIAKRYGLRKRHLDELALRIIGQARLEQRKLRSMANKEMNKSISKVISIVKPEAMKLKSRIISAARTLETRGRAKVSSVASRASKIKKKAKAKIKRARKKKR